MHTYTDKHAHAHTRTPTRCALLLQACTLLRDAQRQSGRLNSYEVWYNGALLAQRRGDLQEAVQCVATALELFPGHTDSRELNRRLRAQLMAVV